MTHEDRDQSPFTSSVWALRVSTLSTVHSLARITLAIHPLEPFAERVSVQIKLESLNIAY